MSCRPAGSEVANDARQASLHGHQPSKGAKVDRELQEEEERILQKKGAK